MANHLFVRNKVPIIKVICLLGNNLTLMSKHTKIKVISYN